MTRRPHPAQLDFKDWTPPDPVVAFAPERIRAASLSSEAAKVISETLAASELGREGVAAAMSAYLGREISLNMLDKYASEAAEDRQMNVVILAALIAVTDDRRVLQWLAEKQGWIVVPDRYRTVIELAQREEAIRRDKRVVKALRRDAISGGIL